MTYIGINKKPVTATNSYKLIINQEKRVSLLDRYSITNKRNKIKGRRNNSALCNKRYRL